MNAILIAIGLCVLSMAIGGFCGWKFFHNNKLSIDPMYEQYYLIVIMNLLKKVNAMGLFQQLESKRITETEFERELKNCSEMYTVNIGKFVNKEDFDIILDISCKIYAVMMNIKMSPAEISDDDMAILFSLDREIFNGIEKEKDNV